MSAEGIFSERKKIFSLGSNIGKKKLAACLLPHIDIAFVSEYLCHLRAQYLIQSPNICSEKYILLLVHSVSATGWPCFLVLLAFGIIQTVLLQLKMISCNPTLAWHRSGILCNPRTPGQSTQMSSTNVKWFNKISSV